MPYTYQNTTYGGIDVSTEAGEKLRNQPAAEFLTIEQNPDNTYHVTSRLPEMGMTEDGKEFRIRENINRLMMGVCKSCIDEDNRIDTGKAIRFLGTLSAWFDEDDGVPPEGLLDKCGVTPQNMDDFMTCFSQPSILRVMELMLPSGTGGLTATLERLGGFAYLLDSLNKKKPNAPGFALEEEILGASYDDYRNVQNAIYEMANTNPAEEKRVMFLADCGDYASLNNALLPFVNNYRQARNLAPVEGSLRIIGFQQQKDDPEHQIIKNFDNHVVFTINVTDGGNPGVISIETTAPGADKFFHYPNEGHTAVGLYRAEEELFAFHTERNLNNVPNAETIIDLKRQANKCREEVRETVVNSRMETNYIVRNMNTRRTPHRTAYKPIILTKKSREAWDTALRYISNAFSATDSVFGDFGSPEYHELASYIGELTETRYNRIEAGTVLNEAMLKIAEKNEAYLKHCDAVPKSNSRRAARVHACEVLSVMSEAAFKGYADPAAYIKDCLIDSFYERLRTDEISLQKTDADRVKVDQRYNDRYYRDQIRMKIQNTESFRSLTEGRDIGQLYDLSAKRDQTFDRFITLLKAHNRAAAQNRPQPAEPQHEVNVQNSNVKKM